MPLTTILRTFLFLAGFALPAVAAERWTPEEFPIGYWLGAPSAANNVEAYRMMKDCGFTLAGGAIGYTKADNLKMLDHCQAVGLKAVVGFHDAMMPGLPLGTDWDALAEAGVQDFGSHPALAGWGLLDEPRADAFPALAQMNRLLGERTPGKLRFINLFPYGADLEQFGTKSHAEYLDRYLTTVKPDVLCYDLYAMMKDGTVREGLYFQNLAIHRAAALRHGVPAWNGILAWSHGPYASPTPAQMRWQVYTSLAYGMKGIMYFILWPMPEWKDNTSPGIVDSSGQPSPIYPEVKKLNHEMQTLGKTLLTLTSTGLFHTAPAPAGAATLDSTALLQVTKGERLCLGFFRGARGESYAMVVNTDDAKSQDIELKPHASVTGLALISHTDAQESPLPMNAGKSLLHLEPGDGAFLKMDLPPAVPTAQQ